jgi:hypothetical protein
MRDYGALQAILGKTISGVIVKEKTKHSTPAMSVHLVFSDNTSYEIYSDFHINFAGGLNTGDVERLRKYGTAPTGPMENVLDLSVDET